MNFYEPEILVQKAEEMLKELPGDFKRQDAEEKTNNAQMFQFMIEMMKEQNANIMEMIKTSNAQVAQLTQAIANMPRPRGGICHIF